MGSIDILLFDTDVMNLGFMQEKLDSMGYIVKAVSKTEIFLKELGNCGIVMLHEDLPMSKEERRHYLHQDGRVKGYDLLAHHLESDYSVDYTVIGIYTTTPDIWKQHGFATLDNHVFNGLYGPRADDMIREAINTVDHR